MTYQQALNQVRNSDSADSIGSLGPDSRPIPAYGLSDHVGQEAIAAWGARTIIQANQLDDVDFVPDGQGTDGGPHASMLLDLLNERCPISTLRLIIAAHRHAGRLRFDEAGTVVLYEDAQLTIDADTNGSCGYLYVTAWLRPTPFPSIWYPPIADKTTPPWLADIHAVNVALPNANVDSLGFGSPEFLREYRGQPRLIERYPEFEVMFPLSVVEVDTGVTITPLTAGAHQRLSAAHKATTSGVVTIYSYPHYLAYPRTEGPWFALVGGGEPPEVDAPERPVILRRYAAADLKSESLRSRVIIASRVLGAAEVKAPENETEPFWFAISLQELDSRMSQSGVSVERAQEPETFSRPLGREGREPGV